VTVRINGKGVVERRQVQGVQIAADRRYQARSGQFIISRIDARHGASGLIPDELNGAVVTNDFPLFDVVEERLDAGFLGWMTKTGSFVELCKRASEGTTNRVRLSEARFMALNIPLPPLDEQRRIVARIEGLVAKVQEARGLRLGAQKALSALQLSRSRAIFEALNDTNAHLESACVAIIDNLHSNPTYSDGGMVPCIRSSDVGYGTLDLVGARRTDEEEYERRTIRGKPLTDDIVLVREGGGTGKCALVERGQKFSLGQRVMMMRPDQNKIRPKFFLYQLLSPTVQEDQIRPLSKGSASPHLNIGALRRFAFALPNFDTQDRVVDELDSLQSRLNSMKALQSETAAELDAMVPALLDKAFKGEL
jgi:type I restriction enzyme S subunit